MTELIIGALMMGYLVGGVLFTYIMGRTCQKLDSEVVMVMFVIWPACVPILAILKAYELGEKHGK